MQEQDAPSDIPRLRRTAYVGTVAGVTTTPSAPAPPAAPATAAPHSRVDDLAGLLTAAVLASIGLQLLQSAGAVTGGTAGLCLLLAQALPVPFAVVYIGINLPFVVLAGTRLGWAFAARSVLAVALVAGLSALTPRLLLVDRIAPGYGAVAGNLLLGVALLVLFRHRSSLGGFNIVALLAQERRGWRAGYVQLALDAGVVAISIAVAPLLVVLWSAAGAVVLNLVLAMNHRPGRYVGS